MTVTSDDTGVKHETRTNRQGNWIVEFLLPGHYHLSVTKAGFRALDRLGIELHTGDDKQFDVQLEIGPANQTVEVTGGAPLIDTTSATSGTVISSKELEELPTSSHVATLFSTLSPGVVAQYQNNNVVHVWSFNGGSQFEADGGRNNIYSNNFLLDGMPDTKSGGNVAFIPPMDSVQEFRVETNAYDASIGRQAGSTVSLETKAGGKGYHGNLYEYNQNDFLNANYFQNDLVGAPQPAVHFNEFGGTFGGPCGSPRCITEKRKRSSSFLMTIRTTSTPGAAYDPCPRRASGRGTSASRLPSSEVKDSRFNSSILIAWTRAATARHSSATVREIPSLQ